jgi:hypothetical protein
VGSFLFFLAPTFSKLLIQNFLSHGIQLRHFILYVGEVPSKPGQLILAGFSGHGIPLICLASKGIAAMLRREKTFGQTVVLKLFKPTVTRLESTKIDILDSLAAPSSMSRF